MTWAAFLVMWAFRDLVIWMRPELIYNVVFPGYGEMLAEGARVAGMIDATRDEKIWVNGMENNIYLAANRKAWSLMIPERTEIPTGEPPKWIVHCAGAVEFDYKDYENEYMGKYMSLMRRKG